MTADLQANSKEESKVKNNYPSVSGVSGRYIESLPDSARPAS
jgi:hypothetical protein